MNIFQRIFFNEGVAIELLARLIEGRLRDLPEERLNAWFVRFGLAFGPPGLRHFSELTAAEQAALLTRVPILRQNHVDYPKPLRWIPRRWTVWVGPAPTLNDMIVGNASEMKPIPHRGEWFVIRGGMASTTIEGVHNRVGWRYDDVDDYWNLAFTIKTFD